MARGNVVDVDPEALRREADAVAAAAPEPMTGAAPAAVPAAAPSGDWRPVADMLVLTLDLAVLPQWNLTAPEKSELAASVDGVLVRLFPGGMDSEQWAPYLRLLAVAGGIVAARALESGKLPAFGPKVKPAAAPRVVQASGMPEPTPDPFAPVADGGA